MWSHLSRSLFPYGTREGGRTGRRRAGRPIVIMTSEAFHGDQRGTARAYTCPFVERDVVCLTNRISANRATVNRFKY